MVLTRCLVRTQTWLCVWLPRNIRALNTTSPLCLWNLQHCRAFICNPRWETEAHPDSRGGCLHTCSFWKVFISGPGIMTVLVSWWARRKDPDRERNPTQDFWQQSMHRRHADLALNEKWGWAVLFWCKAVMSDGHDLLFADEWLLTRKWQLCTKRTR